MTAVPPRPAAPDATPGDGLSLREHFAVALTVHAPTLDTPYAVAGKLVALPALRDVLAAAARDAEKVRRVQDLADRNPGSQWSKSVRRALDGTP